MDEPNNYRQKSDRDNSEGKHPSRVERDRREGNYSDRNDRRRSDYRRDDRRDDSRRDDRRGDSRRDDRRSDNRRDERRDDRNDSKDDYRSDSRRDDSRRDDRRGDDFRRDDSRNQDRRRDDPKRDDRRNDSRFDSRMDAAFSPAEVKKIVDQFATPVHDPNSDKSADTIYISNLPQTVTEQSLAEFFGSVGIIKKDKRTLGPKVWIYRDKVSGMIKGDATVTYADPSAADGAINWFDGKPFEGSILKVEKARALAPPPGGWNAKRGDENNQILLLGGRGGYRGGRF
ncbi:hypothetical protein HDV02_005913 [Globomyces sp. JEL0801]|nr:hypothetical protein HDV02_005913 [Globomyces sp. JEL0801]